MATEYPSHLSAAALAQPTPRISASQMPDDLLLEATQRLARIGLLMVGVGTFFFVIGELLGTLGGWGTGPGEFREPVGITFDPAMGHILITDAGNARIQPCIDLE